MSANPPCRLTPVVTEYVVAGSSFLIAGVLLCAGTALSSLHPGKIVATTALQGGIFGAIFLVGIYRRASRAVSLRRSPPSDCRESRTAMLKRTTAQVLAALVLIGAFAALERFQPIFAAILAGSGAAYLLTGRWLARWERKHDARVLGGSLWRPWDFYVVPR